MNRMMKSQEPVALNYISEEISSALRSLEGGINNAAGFSQSQHNCEDSDDVFDSEDDAAIISSWDASAAACAPRPSASNYDKVAPVLKELMQALENLTPTSFEKGISTVEELTGSLNTRHKLVMGEAPPKGKTVSGKLKAKNPRKKHVKQV